MVQAIDDFFSLLLSLFIRYLNKNKCKPSAFRLGILWDDLPRAVRTVSANPADATGLADRGRLNAGCLADMVRVSMLNETPVIRAVWRGGERV